MIAAPTNCTTDVNASITDRSSSRNARTNYHYYTQPVDPITLAAAARSIRVDADQLTMDASERCRPQQQHQYQPQPPPAPTQLTCPSPQMWRSKLTNIKNSFLGTPRFHRRKMSSGGSGESDSEESQMLDTSEFVIIIVFQCIRQNFLVSSRSHGLDR
jgi:hypothetical protein